MKLLLHCCCAPCTVSCAASLRAENIEPHLFWYNPNIQPDTEYEARRDCFTDFAVKEGLDFSIEEILPRTTRTNTNGKENKTSRCEKCYNMRLEKTASYAVKNKFTAFSTTLLISPYQDHEAIKRAGEELSVKYGVDFLYRDFRPLFREGQAEARKRSLYMQKYCGCILSKEERNLKKKENKPQSSQRNAEAVVQSLNPSASSAVNSSIFERLILITGEEGLQKLSSIKVLIFGAGGVGSWAAEALIRSGVGKIVIIDNDVVSASNVNRQVEATSLTLGQSKAEALKKRLLEINPSCEIIAVNEYFCRENASSFGIENADFVIDAIDTMPHKIDLIETVCKAGVTLFSSMGMAQKTDPSLIKAVSVWKTEGCPLARLVRQELRKRGLSYDFTAVYSPQELPRAEKPLVENCKIVNGSLVTVTASAGLLLASLVFQKVTGL